WPIGDRRRDTHFRVSVGLHRDPVLAHRNQRLFRAENCLGETRPHVRFPPVADISEPLHSGALGRLAWSLTWRGSERGWTFTPARRSTPSGPSSQPLTPV